MDFSPATILELYFCVMSRFFLNVVRARIYMRECAYAYFTDLQLTHT